MVFIIIYPDLILYDQIDCTLIIEYRKFSKSKHPLKENYIYNQHDLPHLNLMV